ncbi:MAG: hypothetical protein LBJ93_01620 [Clostridiales bacterium]|jgi:hypothetical protein|nr:hypothetical protein [Clostridiales bacterium]
MLQQTESDMRREDEMMGRELLTGGMRREDEVIRREAIRREGELPERDIERENEMMVREFNVQQRERIRIDRMVTDDIYKIILASVSAFSCASLSCVFLLPLYAATPVSALYMLSEIENLKLKHSKEVENLRKQLEDVSYELSVKSFQLAEKNSELAKKSSESEEKSSEIKFLKEFIEEKESYLAQCTSEFLEKMRYQEMTFSSLSRSFRFEKDKHRREVSELKRKIEELKNQRPRSIVSDEIFSIEPQKRFPSSVLEMTAQIRKLGIMAEELENSISETTR